MSGIHNSGLFVSALVNGQSIHGLLDTGASLTIISTKVDCSKLNLIAYDQNISTASGSPIKVTGRTRVQLKVADYLYYLDVVIANIDNEPILVLGFLRKMNCRIDVAKEL